MEIDLLKNTSLTSYFNVSSSDIHYLKNMNKIIDGKIYSLNINLRNSGMVNKYCSKKLGYNLKDSNYIGNSVKEYKFNTYKEILELVKTYNDITVIGEKKDLNYFMSNGVKCININDKIDEYNNVLVLDNNMSNDLRYKAYSSTLNDLIIYDMSNTPDSINDLEII